MKEEKLVGKQRGQFAPGIILTCSKIFIILQ